MVNWRKRCAFSCFLLLLICLAISGCTKTFDERSPGVEEVGDGVATKYRREDVVMGTLTTAVIYTVGEDITEDIMVRLSQVEDDYISWRVEGSDIDMINQYAGNLEGVSVSEPTAAYLTQALELSEMSEGAFDPTIGKITRLWNVDGENPHVPEQTEIESLLAECGYEKIHLEGNRVILEENASIDLGAMGKGIGCDEARELLSEDTDVSGAVISVGGSILVYGEKPDGRDWQVAITNPDDDTDYFGILSLSGERYVSTSGDYEKYFEENGERYHHIMNPDTGYPAKSGLVSVSVITDSGLLSDGLSTACFVLGQEKSLPLLEYYGAEAIFVDSDHQVYITEGIREKFTITNEKFRKTW